MSKSILIKLEDLRIELGRTKEFDHIFFNETYSNSKLFDSAVNSVLQTIQRRDFDVITIKNTEQGLDINSPYGLGIHHDSDLIESLESLVREMYEEVYRIKDITYDSKPKIVVLDTCINYSTENTRLEIEKYINTLLAFGREADMTCIMCVEGKSIPEDNQRVLIIL